MAKFKLKKEISLFQAVLFGVGIILGAGIYVLIGKGAAIAGNSLWISFVIAALIAIFTGFSYAELSGMFSKDAAEYVYTKHAFKSNMLSFLVQWIMILTLIISATAVALGFGGYFSYLFNISEKIAAAGLLIVLSIINYIGIRHSTRFNIFSTIIEISGLVLVIVLGFFFIGKTEINYFTSPTGMLSIPTLLSATALIFFAYIGFEEIVNLAEETKNAKKIIPKALLISIAISTLLYILVVVASINILGAERLAASEAPITEVVSQVIPQAKFIISLIALFATASTVLGILVVGSRMIYGLACNHAVPHICQRIGSRGTPYFSVFLVMVLSLLAILIGNLTTVALITDIGIFTVYLFINFALIFLRYRAPNVKRTFRSPINIGKFPLLALLGIFSAIVMIFQFEPILLLFELGIIVIGLITYKIFAVEDKFEHKAHHRLFRKSRYTIHR